MSYPRRTPCDEYLTAFNDKFVPTECCLLPPQTASPERTGNQTLHRMADAFELCVAELESQDCINRVHLSGSADSLLASPAIHHGFPKGYTVCMWIRLDKVQRSDSIILYSARASNLCSTECAVTLGDESEQTHCRVDLRVQMNHRDVQTASGRINLHASATWHLVTIVHKYCSFPFHGAATVMVDGEIALERDLDYPFKPLSALADVSTAFEFGAGMTGSLGVVSVYAEEMSPEVIRCLTDAGPTFVSWAGTAMCPQNSNETGHSHLSLHFDKLTRNGSIYPPIFYLTSDHFNEEEWLPCVVPSGRTAPGDMVQLEGRIAGNDFFAAPKLLGSCEALHNASLWRVWESSTGPSVVLFLLHQCIKEFTENSNMSAVERAVDNSLSRTLEASIRLLAKLVKHSFAMREFFLQEHGFHVLSACLRSLPCRSEMLTAKVIEECLTLVRSLKTDLMHGDAVAAALQGLLFDFSVWRHVTLSNKVLLLTSIANLTPTIGSNLKQYIGLQRILDICREHVISFKDAVKNGEDEAAEGAVLQLVILVLRTAQYEYEKKSSAQDFAEINIVFSCIEETTNTRFAETLMRHTIELLYDCPDAFTKALAATRFYDVTAVKLLTSAAYSSEMRQSALHLFLWGLIQEYPDLIRDILYWLKKFGRDTEGGEVWYQHDVHEMPLSLSERNSRERQGRKPMELLSVLITKKATLSKMWNMTCMVCTATERSIDSWVIPDNENDNADRERSTLDAGVMFVGSADYLLGVLCQDGPLGGLDCWISLPWLAVLVHHGSLQMCQKALMSFSMSLKINEYEIVALGVLPDSRWIYHFLQIAKAMHGHLLKLGGEDLFSDRVINEYSEHRSFAENDVRTYASVAKSCLDVALDSLAQVIVYQTIHFGDAGCQSWQQLVIYLQLQVMKEHEMDYLRQCVIFMFQKISRNHCGYNRYVLYTLTRIATLVEEKHLCGNFLSHASDMVLGKISQSELGLEIHQIPSIGDTDIVKTFYPTLLSAENKLLSFAIELSHKIRQGSEGHSLGNNSPEIKIILIFLRTFTSCLYRLSPDMTSAVCCEIEAIVVHSIDGWLFYSAEYYHFFVLSLLNSLFVACRDQSIHPMCREKLKKVTASIIHLFTAIRKTCDDDMLRHYPHVGDTVNFLGVADNCYDADEIFAVLNKSLEVMFDCSEDNSINTAVKSTYTIKVKENEWTPAPSTLKQQATICNAITGDGEPEEMLFVTELSSVEDESESNRLGNGLCIPTSLDPRSQNMQDQNADQPFYIDLVAISQTSSRSVTNRVDLHHKSLTADSVDDLLMDYDGCESRMSTNEETITVCSQSQMQSYPSSPIIPAVLEYQETQFIKWKTLSEGVMTDRIDTERARMERFAMSTEMTAFATNEFWTKLSRKIDTETFDRYHKQMWELAMRFEGQFPGRQRIVLLPWFLGSAEKEEMAESVKGAAALTNGDEDTGSSEIFLDSLVKDDGHMREQLVGAYIGHDNFMVHSDISRYTPELELRESSMHHGQSWSVVDVDAGEDGGYGVVGLAGIEYDSSASGTPALTGENEEDGITVIKNAIVRSERLGDPTVAADNQDSLLDLTVMAEGLQQGRDVETAPCFSGTKKLSRDVHVAEVSDVSLLTAVGNFIGTISFTDKEIFFSTANDVSLTRHLHDDAAITLEAAHKKVRRRKWHVDAITGIYLRSYRLRQSGVEVLFTRGKYRSFFIDFGSAKSDMDRRDKFVNILCEVAPKYALKQRPGMSFHRMISSHGIQQEWINGRISNFDYLMYINTIAGRSFNDLCQYPVMPWVIAQYEGDTIDLNNHATYRDLSKPMGAQTEARLERIRCRYEALAETDDVLPPFMYGSHYSTMVGVVLYYLLRLQPYAELHKVVQSGHFDTANRLFASVKKAWKHNSETTFEVKELTPEWFTLPDFLRNVNNFDLGRNEETEEHLGDVELPNWAASPEDFIRINRAALESDFVSSHLHEWIDLIFGYKQRGSAAVEANNLFYYLTYPGAIDREKMDAATLEGVDAQIAHFGQCPSLVFDAPHPAKRMCHQLCVPRPLRQCFSIQAGKLGIVDPYDTEEALSYNASYTAIGGRSLSDFLDFAPMASASVIGLKLSGPRIFCVRDNGEVNVYRHTVTPDVVSALKSAPKALQMSDANEKLPNFRSSSGLVIGVVPETRGGFVRGMYDLLGRTSQSDGATLHRLPVQRMKEKLEDRRASMDASSICNARRTHFVGRMDDVVVLTAGRSDGLIYIHSLENSRGDADGSAYFSGHMAAVTCISHDQKCHEHNQSIVCSCDQNGVAVLWAVTKKTAFLSKSYLVSRHPIRSYRALPSAFSCCDLSLELGVVVVGSRNLVSVYSIEYDMKLRDIDVAKDICNSARPSNSGAIVKCYIQHVALSNYGSITLFVQKELQHEFGKVVQMTHIMASYSVNGNLTVLIEVPWSVTCLISPKKDALLIAGCSDGSILFLLQGSLEIIHNIKPIENCKTFVPKVASDSTVQDNTEVPSSVDFRSNAENSAITCIQSGPEPDFPALVAAANADGEIFLIPLPDYIRWDREESSKTIMSNILQTPLSAIHGTLQQAQSITEHAAGKISHRILGGRAIVDNAINKVSNYFRRPQAFRNQFIERNEANSVAQLDIIHNVDENSIDTE